MPTRLNKQQEEAMENIVQEKILEKFNDRWMESLITKICEKVEISFKDRFDKQERQIVKLEKQVSSLKSDIEQLQINNDKLEQYSRKNDIRIFGLKEKRNENIVEETYSFFKQKLGAQIERADIREVNRIGKNMENRDRPIIVKFMKESSKNEVFYKKKQLKGTGITMREDLTKARLDLIKVAIEQFESKNVWTQGGRVFVFAQNRKHVVNNIEDINNLL